MAALTNYSEDLLLTYLFTTSSVSRPSSWYVALHTGDPGEDGTANEVTTALDSDYSRRSITFSDPVPDSGQIISDSGVSWDVSASSPGYTVTHVSVWTSISGGHCLVKGRLLTPILVSSSEVITFAAGNIIISLD